ncbi:MAG: hypothetical protein NXI21_10470 [Alphaproteobacteria bacterium]|nr:hypothetical protein [Alphaproteobacteria bacterium]
MIRVDYRDYLDQQSRYAASLLRQAKRAEGARARELADLAGDALMRMTRVWRRGAPDG